MSSINYDKCPVCDRIICDFDMTGIETEIGQRWCADHYLSFIHYFRFVTE